MNTNPAYLLFHRRDGAPAEAKVLITCFGAPLSHLLSLLCLSLQVLDAPSAICHYLDDNSCSALIILGFVMMSPLVVVAAAVFCGLLRKFRLLLFIQPIKRAWYRGRLLDWAGSIHAWVWSQLRRWCWGSQWLERLICARRTWGLQMFCKNRNIIIVDKTVIQLILTLSMVVKTFDIFRNIRVLFPPVSFGEKINITLMSVWWNWSCNDQIINLEWDKDWKLRFRVKPKTHTLI